MDEHMIDKKRIVETLEWMVSGTKTHISGHFTCQGQQKPSCFGPTIQASNLTGIDHSYTKNQYCSINASLIYRNNQP